MNRRTTIDMDFNGRFRNPSTQKNAEQPSEGTGKKGYKDRFGGGQQAPTSPKPTPPPTDSSSVEQDVLRAINKLERRIDYLGEKLQALNFDGVADGVTLVSNEVKQLGALMDGKVDILNGTMTPIKNKLDDVNDKFGNFSRKIVDVLANSTVTKKELTAWENKLSAVESQLGKYSRPSSPGLDIIEKSSSLIESSVAKAIKTSVEYSVKTEVPKAIKDSETNIKNTIYAHEEPKYFRYARSCSLVAVMFLILSAIFIGHSVTNTENVVFAIITLTFFCVSVVAVALGAIFSSSIAEGIGGASAFCVVISLLIAALTVTTLICSMCLLFMGA